MLCENWDSIQATLARTMLHHTLDNYNLILFIWIPFCKVTLIIFCLGGLFL